MSDLAVTVHGAEGRMGRLVTELVDATPDLHLAALVTEEGRSRAPGSFHPTVALSPQSRLAEVHPRGGVVVDFSLAAALDGLLAGAEATAAPLVIGTTGFSDDQVERLAAYAQARPVVLASNFSVGVPALRLVLERLADLLPEAFQAEQVEIHHRHKLDRPSGTARSLAAVWAQQRGGEAPPTHSLRIGGVTGEHRWILSDDEETLELVHRAHSRRAFLRGVAPAIRFVARAAPGLYGMEDVLSAS